MAATNEGDSASEPSSILETWGTWIDRIKRDLIYLHHHRELWKATTDAIIERAPASPAVWINHYGQLYVNGQAMAIRRIIRAKGPDTISLGRFMESIEEHAEVLCRSAVVERFVARTDGAEHWFDYVGDSYDQDWNDGTGQLDLAKVRRDRAEINRIAGDVIELADVAVAHISAQARPALTFGELDGAIVQTGELFQKYAGLVTSTHYVLTPAVDEWRSSFYEPLFDKPWPGWPQWSDE